MNRLRGIEEQERQKKMMEMEIAQKQLSERRKKYDVSTTFVPKLDGAKKSPREASESTIVRHNVRSIAEEMEKLEEESEDFPLQPILRSRSAKSTRDVSKNRTLHHSETDR